jgi:hypothetical protein
VAGSWVHETSLNGGRRTKDLRSGFNVYDGGILNLIIAARNETGGSQRSRVWQQRESADAVVPWPTLPEWVGWRLQSPFLDDVWSYGSGVGRRTHLRWSRASMVTGAKCATAVVLPRASVVARAHDGGAPASLLASMAATWLPLAYHIVELAWAAVKSHVWGLLGYDGFFGLWAKEGAIYRGFDTHA